MVVNKKWWLIKNGGHTDSPHIFILFFFASASGQGPKFKLGFFLVLVCGSGASLEV